MNDVDLMIGRDHLFLVIVTFDIRMNEFVGWDREYSSSYRANVKETYSFYYERSAKPML